MHTIIGNHEIYHDLTNEQAFYRPMFPFAENVVMLHFSLYARSNYPQVKNSYNSDIKLGHFYTENILVALNILLETIQLNDESFQYKF